MGVVLFVLLSNDSLMKPAPLLTAQLDSELPLS